jgi:hypothetical protein
MKQPWTIAALALAAAAPFVLADPGHHFGRQVRYSGPHPIPKSAGGGMCHIEGPHVHIYPANKLEYRDHDGDHYFVGDPEAYGWDGPHYAYKGPHPIHVEGDPNVEWCYIEGPHYHVVAPTDDDDFKQVGGAYFYVGTPPPVFVQDRPTYVGINAYYRPMVYTRPVITVDAPTGWIGARAEFVGPGVVVDHRGEVVAPAAVGVQVGIPMPSLHVGIDIGGPAVIVHDHPAPVIIERDHRDNGRHEGWHKHGRH